MINIDKSNKIITNKTNSFKKEKFIGQKQSKSTSFYTIFGPLLSLIVAS